MIGCIKCARCAHLIEKNTYPTPWKCDAFPDGFPEMKLAYINFDDCIDCNNGIGFVPDPTPVETFKRADVEAIEDDDDEIDED